MGLHQRLARLENKLGVTSGPGPYPHLIITNVPPEDDHCAVELVPGRFVDVIGRALSAEEFEQLREDWKRRHGVDE